MAEKKRADILRDAAIEHAKLNAIEFVDDIFEKRLLPIANAGGFYETIDSEEKAEFSCMHNDIFRAEVIKILKKEGFGVDEIFDSGDKIILTINWEPAEDYLD